jgi:hypothetical protein
VSLPLAARGGRTSVGHRVVRVAPRSALRCMLAREWRRTRRQSLGLFTGGITLSKLLDHSQLRDLLSYIVEMEGLSVVSAENEINVSSLGSIVRLRSRPPRWRGLGLCLPSSSLGWVGAWCRMQRSSHALVSVRVPRRRDRCYQRRSLSGIPARGGDCLPGPGSAQLCGGESHMAEGRCICVVTSRRFAGATTPREFGPCGICLDHGAPLLT